MDHFIDQIEIKNFKSIRELTLTGFKRINLFIGRPNVGKSNLLEALALFSLPFIWDDSKLLSQLIRVANIRELFFDGNVSDEIEVKGNFQGLNSSNLLCTITYFQNSNSPTVIILKHQVVVAGEVENISSVAYSIDKSLALNSSSKNHTVQPTYGVMAYRFTDKPRFKEDIASTLLPPNGSNLLSVLETTPNLRKQIAGWFRQYGLRLVLDTASQSLKIQKDKGDEVFQLPYSSVADTLQRIIFYKTAIASNENSVLLFEEPEAHAYPPYISEFTQEVIGSKTNQTFIVTHSPLIVNDMLDNAIDDLAIFIVDFKDGQTVSRSLTQEELHEVRKFGVDLFFNGESYPV